MRTFNKPYNKLQKLAIITTHPVQYNAPLFKLIAGRGQIAIKVFYTWSQARGLVYDPGFRNCREWDIPLLEGYEFTFIENTAVKSGSHHFHGIVNPSLVAEINRWEPDAVLVYGWSFHSHLRCLRYFKGRLPVLFRGDSTLLDEQSFLRSFSRKLLLKWIYRHIDIALYVGANNKQYFQKFGLKESQLVYAPHAVDNRRFTRLNPAEKTEARQWRKELGFSEKDWVLLFVGKLEEKKNPQFIIELAERIKEKHIKFLLVGNGHLENQLKNVAKTSRVVFLGFQNQSKMPTVYRLAQAFILPSKGPGETWGLAANEAMCAGLPVILSAKVGGAPDLIVNGTNGLIFQPDEVERVEDYVRHLYNDQEACIQAGQKAMLHIQQFNLDSVAAAIEDTVQTLLEKTALNKNPISAKP